MAAANDQFDPGAVVRVEDLPALPGDFAKEAANISPEVRDTLFDACSDQVSHLLVTMDSPFVFRVTDEMLRDPDGTKVQVCSLSLEEGIVKVAPVVDCDYGLKPPSATKRALSSLQLPLLHFVAPVVRPRVNYSEFPAAAALRVPPPHPFGGARSFEPRAPKPALLACACPPSPPTYS